MPATKNKPLKNTSRKRTPKAKTFESRSISAKETLFPEKVAEAKDILRNTKFHDPDIFF